MLEGLTKTKFLSVKIDPQSQITTLYNSLRSKDQSFFLKDVDILEIYMFTYKTLSTAASNIFSADLGMTQGVVTSEQVTQN